MKKIKICDECNSEYYENTSEMDNLCPNCSFFLYGYKNCKHEFEKGGCIKCFWNGKTSKFIDEIIKKSKKSKSIEVFYDEQDTPYFSIPKNPYVTFQIANNDKTVEIMGNKSGLRLMAKALLGMAETERTDGFHIHIDDLYNINKEDKEFIINREENIE